MLRNKMALEVDDDMLREIFRSIDIDDSKDITWAEFKLDFEKCVTLSTNALLEEERQMAALAEDSMSLDDSQQHQKYGIDQNTKFLELERQKLNLEGKLDNAYKDLALKADNEKRLMESVNQTQNRLNELRKENGDKLEKYNQAMMKIQQLT